MVPPALKKMALVESCLRHLYSVPLIEFPRSRVLLVNVSSRLCLYLVSYMVVIVVHCRGDTWVRSHNEYYALRPLSYVLRQGTIPE